MRSLNRNRFIGGAVLIMAGLMFVPAILTPSKQNVKNPIFKVNMDSSISEQTPSAEGSEINLDFQLESVDNSDAPIALASLAAPITKPEDLAGSNDSNKNNAKSSMVPINLESLGSVGDVSSTSKSNNTKPVIKKKESWLRVGSFSNLANADKLAEELKRKKYSVKIENTSVVGTPYRRVLIGPFGSDQERQKVLDQIRLDGFSPTVQ